MKYVALFISGLFINLLMACSQQVPFKLRAEQLGLEFVSDIKLTGGTTRFDYQSIDPNQRRLYMAHMGSDMITVVDIDSEKVVNNIVGLPNVHGVIAVPEIHRVYASATGRNEVAVIDDNSLQIITKIKVGNYPDGLTYAPIQKRVFISDEHGKTVSVIDAVKNILLKKIEIGGEVGNTHYDSFSGLIYSADQTNNQLVAIDPDQLKIIKRYDLQGCEGAHGFYIDEQTHYAFITGEDNGSIITLDLTSGKIVSQDRVGSSPDVLDYDQEKHLLFVSCESGTVSVFKVEQGNVSKKSETFFYSNAHSVCVDQNKHLIFFPLKSVDGEPVLRLMRIL